MNTIPKAAIRIDGSSFPLQLEASSENGCVVVRCRGQLIAATADFFKTEATCRIDQGKIFTLDLNELTHLDGSGLRALFSVLRMAQKAKCKFWVEATPHVEELLLLTSLGDRSKPEHDNWRSLLGSG